MKLIIDKFELVLQYRDFILKGDGYVSEYFCNYRLRNLLA